MEDEIDGIDPAEYAGLQKLVNAAHAFSESIRKVDGEQPVGGASSLDDGTHFLRCAAERLSAKDRGPGVQRLDRLFGMHRARGGDHHAVHIRCEYLLKIGDQSRVGRELLRFGRHFR